MSLDLYLTTHSNNQVFLKDIYRVTTHTACAGMEPLLGFTGTCSSPAAAAIPAPPPIHGSCVSCLSGGPHAVTVSIHTLPVCCYGLIGMLTYSSYAAHIFQCITIVLPLSPMQTRLPVYFSHTPAGTSVKNADHLAQVCERRCYNVEDLCLGKQTLGHVLMLWSCVCGVGWGGVEAQLVWCEWPESWTRRNGFMENKPKLVVWLFLVSTSCRNYFNVCSVIITFEHYSTSSWTSSRTRGVVVVLLCST